MKMPKYSQDNQEIKSASLTFELFMCGVLARDNAIDSLWRNYKDSSQMTSKVVIANKIRFIHENQLIGRR